MLGVRRYRTRSVGHREACTAAEGAASPVLDAREAVVKPHLGVDAGTVDVARVSATFGVRSGDEVYVYVRGRLVMKRWLRTGVSATFHVAPAGVRWSR